MNTAVLVPWRSDRGGQRDRLWEWVFARWVAVHPDWSITTGDSGDEPFTRGRSIMLAAEKAPDADIYVVADADTAFDIDTLADAYDAVATRRAPWAIGYPREWYVSMDYALTDLWLDQPPGSDLPEPWSYRMRIVAYSGLVIIRREDFEDVGGFDARFHGWGFEDNAFQHKCDTLLGPHYRPPFGWVAHLCHAHLEEERFGQPFAGLNKAICDQYAAADGDVEAMWTIVKAARSYAPAP